MHPYTGDYTEQRKNGKLNFIYYTFTPRPLKGNTFFKIDDELMALLIETYHKGCFSMHQIKTHFVN